MNTTNLIRDLIKAVETLQGLCGNEPPEDADTTAWADCEAARAAAAPAVTGNYACNQCGYHVPLADEYALLSTGEGDDSCECGGTFTQKTRAECRPREQYCECEEPALATRDGGRTVACLLCGRYA